MEEEKFWKCEKLLSQGKLCPGLLAGDGLMHRSLEWQAVSLALDLWGTLKQQGLNDLRECQYQYVSIDQK